MFWIAERKFQITANIILYSSLPSQLQHSFYMVSVTHFQSFKFFTILLAYLVRSPGLKRCKRVMTTGAHMSGKKFWNVETWVLKRGQSLFFTLLRIHIRNHTADCSFRAEFTTTTFQRSAHSLASLRVTSFLAALSRSSGQELECLLPGGRRHLLLTYCLLLIAS